MEQQNIQNQTNNNSNSKVEDTSAYSLRDIFEMVLANWYWFVISIGLCMVVATYYVYKTPKVYQRSATIMIKDSRRGGSAAAIFADLSSMKAIPNVDNEMFILGMNEELYQEAMRTHDYSLLSKHLYRVQKLAKGDYFFRHHLETTVDDISATAKEMGKLKRLSLKSLKENNPHKVHISITGKITEV